MQSSLVSGQLVVKKSSVHGYGVFAGQDFLPDQIIEECIVLEMNELQPELSNYYFRGGENKHLLVLGNGSLYNHANDANANHSFNEERKAMIFRAATYIKKGEEIFIYYGKNWFSSRQLVVKESSIFYKIKKFIKSYQTFFRISVVTALLFFVLFILRH